MRTRRKAAGRKVGRTVLAGMSIVAVLVGILTAVAPAATPAAHAASGADFNPGNIISDAEFFTPDTMTPDQIQAFLVQKNPNCRAGYTCLTNYAEATPAQPARFGCSSYGGSPWQSAASIIWAAGHSCGINPKVLLVLLEKEQGLVTDSWPSSRQFRSATGFACPDTAACDSAYYGFTNQVFSAASQYRRYQARPNSFGYLAGQVNTIYWSPNSACGSSRVFIENQATAGLYDYTPYRPNAAALNNMYGVGDSCSSYGNRNFFRIYTDWFGSTQGPGASLISADGRVYVVNGGTKYYVPSSEVLLRLAALGGVVQVSSSYAAIFTTAPVEASPVVQDVSTGRVYLAERDGTIHWFSSCDLVTEFGYSCGTVTNLRSDQVARFAQGGAVSAFYQVPGDPAVYWENSGSRYHVGTWGGILKLSGGQVPFIGTADGSVVGRRPVVRTLVEPQSLARGSNGQTWFIDGLASRILVTDPALVTDYAPSGVQAVSDRDLAAYPVAPGILGLTARCGSATVVAAGGRLVSWSGGGDDVGAVSTTLSDDTCNRMSGGGSVAGPLFLRSNASPVIWGYTAGQKFAVPDWTSLLAMNGGSAPRSLVVSPATVAELPTLDTPPSTGTVVTAAGDPDVYVIDGRTKTWLTSFTTASELGLPAFRWVSPSSLGLLRRAAGAVSRQITCNGVTRLAVAGQLVPLTSPQVTGLPTWSPSSALCSRLTFTDDDPRGDIYITSPDRTVVYHLTGGALRPVANWDRLLQLTGGAGPRILFTKPGGLAGLPVGPAA